MGFTSWRLAESSAKGLRVLGFRVLGFRVQQSIEVGRSHPKRSVQSSRTWLKPRAQGPRMYWQPLKIPLMVESCLGESRVFGIEVSKLSILLMIGGGWC